MNQRLCVVFAAVFLCWIDPARADSVRIVVSAKVDEGSVEKKSSSEFPEWRPSFVMPTSSLGDFDAIVFKGETKLKDRKFDRNVTSQGPLKAKHVKFARVLVQGEFDGNEIKAEEITVQGVAYVTNCLVGTLKTWGQLVATNLKADEMHYNGDCHIKDSEISGELRGQGSLTCQGCDFGDVRVSGVLSALNTSFKHVTVMGRRCYFEGKSLNTLILGGKSKTVVYIRGVSGIEKIIFEGTKGIVYTDGDIKALQKRVQNGNVQKI